MPFQNFLWFAHAFERTNTLNTSINFPLNGMALKASCKFWLPVFISSKSFYLHDRQTKKVFVFFQWWFIDVKSYFLFANSFDYKRTFHKVYFQISWKFTLISMYNHKQQFKYTLNSQFFLKNMILSLNIELNLFTLIKTLRHFASQRFKVDIRVKFSLKYCLVFKCFLNALICFEKCRKTRIQVLSCIR